MDTKTFDMVDRMRNICGTAAIELSTWISGNKSAGRRARKLLDQIAKDKVALRRVMIEADKNS